MNYTSTHLIRVFMLFTICCCTSLGTAQKSRIWEVTEALPGYSVSDLVANDSFLIAGMFGAGISVNKIGDTTWTMHLINERDNDVTAVLLYDSTIVIVGTSRGKLYQSATYGERWEEIVLSGRLRAIYSLAQVNRTVYIGTDVGITYYDVPTQDIGQIALPVEEGVDVPMFCITTLPNLVLAGSRGVVYTQRTNDTFVVSESFTQADIIDIKPVRERIVAATAGDYFYGRARAGDRQWKQRKNEKSSTVTYAMLTYGDKLYKGSNGKGIIEADQESESGAETAEVTSLCVFGKELYAGTRGIGILKRSLKEKEAVALESTAHLMTTVVSKPTYVDTKVSIFPNPATTSIEVNLSTIPEEETKQVQILDTNGKLMYTAKVEGTQREFDVSSLPAGTYELHVRSLTHESTTPFVVIR